MLPYITPLYTKVTIYLTLGLVSSGVFPEGCLTPTPDLDRNHPPLVGITMCACVWIEKGVHDYLRRLHLETHGLQQDMFSALAAGREAFSNLFGLCNVVFAPISSPAQSDSKQKNPF